MLHPLRGAIFCALAVANVQFVMSFEEIKKVKIEKVKVRVVNKIQDRIETSSGSANRTRVQITPAPNKF